MIGCFMAKFKTILLIMLLVVSQPLWSSQRFILVVGDSLSAAYGIDAQRGWVNLLRQRLAAHNDTWQVINRSISGDTTAGGLARLPALLQTYRPQIVIIELGSNDGLRGFSFKQMRQNLNGMIEAVQAAGGQVVLVGGRLPPNYGAAYADAFHALFKEVAQDKQVPLVPFLLERVALDPSLMQADGYHPNEAAQPHLLETVWPVLESVL
jgi:acyl-CoA thioesterase-1